VRADFGTTWSAWTTSPLCLGLGNSSVVAFPDLRTKCQRRGSGFDGALFDFKVLNSGSVALFSYSCEIADIHN
jgi:hypothetical protein